MTAHRGNYAIGYHGRERALGARAGDPADRTAPRSRALARQGGAFQPDATLAGGGRGMGAYGRALCSPEASGRGAPAH
jgi:hypothetical protein